MFSESAPEQKAELARLRLQVKVAATRLHHLSMRYVGAVVEIATGKEVAFIPVGTPGVSQVRDLIDLLMYCRAEVNGLSNLLFKKNLITEAEYLQEMAEQYEWFTKQKAQALGVGVTDDGLVYNNPNYGKDN